MNKKLVVLVIALIAGVGWSLRYRSEETGKVAGTIEADEVRVGARVGGRVVELFAQEGERLTNDQIVARLEAPELQARRDYAAASLAELEAGPREQEITAAKNDWEALQIQASFAQAEAERKKKLYAEKSISSTDFENALAQAEALEKQVGAAKERYSVLAAGTRSERIDQARAQLDELDAQLKELNIRAPGSTILETLHVKVGDIVPPNGAVATLLYDTHCWVRVYVPEPWLGFIEIGQTLSLRFDSLRDQKFEGVVEQINRRAEFTPRNVQTTEERVKQVFGVKIKLRDENTQLRPGMTAHVVFPNVPPRPH